MNKKVKFQNMELFSVLSEKELKMVDELSTIMNVERGQYIFQEEDEPIHFFVVISGRMKVFFLSPEGKEQILYIYGKGESIGGFNLLDNVEFNYSAVALEKMQVAKIPKNIFLELFHRNLKFQREIVGQLWVRLRWAESLISRLSLNDAYKKVARILVDLIPKCGKRSSDFIHANVDIQGEIFLKITLTHDEIGSFTGISRETVSRQLKRLSEKGLIKIERGKGIWICNLQKLKACIV